MKAYSSAKHVWLCFEGLVFVGARPFFITAKAGISLQKNLLSIQATYGHPELACSEFISVFQSPLLMSKSPVRVILSYEKSYRELFAEAISKP